MSDSVLTDAVVVITSFLGMSYCYERHQKNSCEIEHQRNLFCKIQELSLNDFAISAPCPSRPVSLYYSGRSQPCGCFSVSELSHALLSAFTKKTYFSALVPRTTFLIITRYPCRLILRYRQMCKPCYAESVLSSLSFMLCPPVVIAQLCSPVVSAFKNCLNSIKPWKAVHR